MKPLGVSARLVMWLVVVSLLPIGLLTMTFLSVFQAQLSTEVEQQLARDADHKLDAIDRYVSQRIRDARLLARSSETQRALATLAQLYREHGAESETYLSAEAEYRDYFARLVDADFYYDILLVAPGGEVIFSVLHQSDFATNLINGRYRDSALGKSVRQAFSILGTEMSDFGFYPPSARPAAFISAPVLGNSRLLGVVALQIDPRFIQQTVTDNIGTGSGSGASASETIVAHQEGDRLVYMAPTANDPAAAFNRLLRPEQTLYQPMLAALHGARGHGRVSGKQNTDDIIAAWRYLSALRWGMVIQVDRAAALAPVWHLRELGLIVMTLIIIAVLATAWLLGRSVVRPLARLTSASTRIAAGDLGRRVPVTGFHEARQLGISFNTMAAHLQTAQQTLEQKVEQRTEQLETSNRLLRNETREHARANDKLRQAAKVFDNASEAILITRADFGVIRANQAYHEVSGYSDEDLLGHPPRLTGSAVANQQLLAGIRSGIASDGNWSGELTNRRKDGEAFPIWLRVDAVNDQQGELQNYVLMFSDISQLKETEKRLQELAYSDFLTGLPNRLLFRERLEQEISSARRRKQLTALLYIDLDRFKQVNDSLGHDAGDKLLREVARRLRQCVRSNDTVARLGGDEFTLIVTDLSAPVEAAPVAGKVLEVLTQPIRLQGHDIIIGASIGIAVAPTDGDDHETLEQHADIAMYHAKDEGRNNFQFFTERLNQHSRRQLLLQNELRQALAQQQFELLYQPIVRLDDRSMVGMEVLLRWNHPQRGLLAPDQFLDVAEDTGLILPIGDWVLSTACTQAASWQRLRQKAGLPPFTISINLSKRQFQDSMLPARMVDILHQSGLAAAQLDLELTEDMLNNAPDEAAAMLKNLRAMGIGLVLDDFGTGHSSLGALRQLPVRCLKIDRSFTTDLPDNADACAIAAAIIKLSSSLGLVVVAEGVETQAQLAYLHQQGCTQAQGYLFAGALTTADSEAWLLAGADPQ